MLCFLYGPGEPGRYPTQPMVIVDLYSQRDAVAAMLREIDSSNKLDWLRERGELLQMPTSAPGSTIYKFLSNAGIETGFVIRDGQMIFLGDNTTAGAVNIGG